MEGIQAILGAMTKYPTSKEIQLNGVKASWNLLLDIKANPELFITELNGIDFVTKVMASFPDDTEVVHGSCKVLLKMSQCENMRQSMNDANVVSALAAAIDGQKGKEDIQRPAREAMKLLR